MGKQQCGAPIAGQLTRQNIYEQSGVQGMLNQTRLKQLIVILLTGATGSVLLLNLPTVETTMQYWAYALTFTFLTALSLPLGVLMSEGEISMVHVVGIIAFLTLEDSAVSVTLWALFIGSLAGGAALLLRTQPYLPRRRSVRRSIQTIMVTSARVTLSFYASAQFYFLIGGDLPIRIGGSDVVLPLAEYAAFYIVTYAAIYALELYIEDQNLLQIVRRDWNQIIAILATPVAYAVLAAVIHTTLPYQLFILAVLGLILLITVTFSYSRNQYLLRQQLDEVNALSALGLRLQVSESPDELMRSVQGQLLHILDTHNMIVTQQPPDYEAPHVLLHIHNNERRRTIETADSFLIERIANTGLPVLIEQDVRAFLAEQGGPPVERPVESWLGMPMIVRGRVIGAIALYAAGNRVFSTSDTRRLRIVASTLANALDNARLYQQQEERVARLNTLNTIS
ncbi:MAG: GAF domain-containing protein, partial [Chloroflexota bacterium]